MGSAPAEVSLDLRLFTARTVSGFLKEASAAAGDGMVAELEKSIGRLEEEKRKIEAFKRELPLCMNLLTDVIEGLEKELNRCRSRRCARVFGEFISIDSSRFEEENRANSEIGRAEKNWMSSAQLWSDNSGMEDLQDDKNEKKVAEEGDEVPNCQKRQKNENASTELKSISSGGAFVPFKALPAANSRGEGKPAVGGFPHQSLQTAPAMDSGSLGRSAAGEDQLVRVSSCKGAGRAPGSTPAKAGEHHISQAHHQPARKVRRCWSPKLHRRFLFALQQLGGAQVATPKQIRELMNVDGLTNDEVKSHLQKYRLHARRMLNSPGSASRPLSVPDTAWVPEERHSNTAQQSYLKSGSPQSPLQLTVSNRSISITAGDSCEEEDGKSESCSCK